MTRFVIPRVVFVNLEFNCCNYPPSPFVNEELICMDDWGEAMRRHTSNANNGHGCMVCKYFYHKLFKTAQKPD